MRIVILSPSVYSETACAMAIRLVRAGHAPVGALALSTLSARTIIRKLGQWGARGVMGYARTKAIAPRNSRQALHNPYLRPLLENTNGTVRSLHEVGKMYAFPVATCANHNAADAIARLQEWNPDAIIFCGGNILRKPLLDIPRLGVLNAHLALLPEIRGMSSPEWSLLKNVSAGITIHFIDSGIDTGPILQTSKLPDAASSKSLSDLRHRLIAFGIEKMAEVIALFDDKAVVATPQSGLAKDNQHFVMHEWLQSCAAQSLAHATDSAVSNFARRSSSPPQMVHPC
jgi:folate-dependent phosphoribosylglycinamide formyltransferase PurN